MNMMLQVHNHGGTTSKVAWNRLPFEQLGDALDKELPTYQAYVISSHDHVGMCLTTENHRVGAGMHLSQLCQVRAISSAM